MKSSIKRSVLVLLLVFTPILINNLMSQPPRPPHRPPSGGNPIGGSAPIGGGTEILLILSAAYAYKKHKTA